MRISVLGNKYRDIARGRERGKQRLSYRMCFGEEMLLHVKMFSNESFRVRRNKTGSLYIYYHPQFQSIRLIKEFANSKISEYEY